MKKLNYKCLLVLLFIFIASSLCFNIGLYAATTGKIQGTITDSQSKDPLPGVNVVIEGTILGAATDENGFFFIINVPPGTYQLKASMIGYALETKSEVRVYVDRTTTIDFSLKTQAVAGEEVTVTAKREVVPLDVAATETYVSGEDIVESSTIRFDQMIALQAGVQMSSDVEDGEGFKIRGGEIGETNLQIDGISMRDELTKLPNLAIRRNMIQDVQILTGGFNAEYGDIRSGLINVVTKDGSYNRYSGVLEYRHSPAERKHYGTGPYDWNSRWYVDHLGSNWHVWDKDATGIQYVSPDALAGWGSEKLYRQEDYIEAYEADLVSGVHNPGADYIDSHPYTAQFVGGWNKIGDDRPYTRDTAVELFKWEFRGKEYGNRPDQMVDIGIGGPVPVLRNTKFYTSHFWNKSFYVVPTARDFSTEMTNTFKVTSRIKSNMNLVVNFQYSLFHGMGWNQSNDAPDLQYVSGDNLNMSNYNYSTLRWDESYSNPKKMDNYYGQIKFTHTYSPTTYYDIAFSLTRVFNNEDFIRQRDFTKVKFIDDPELTASGYLETAPKWNPPSEISPNGYYEAVSAGLPVGRVGLDERPRGFYNAELGRIPGSQASTYDYDANFNVYLDHNQEEWVHVNTTTAFFNANLVSQVNKYNQIKTGVQIYRHHINYLTYMGLGFRPLTPKIVWPYFYVTYDADPTEYNFYIHDKLEWEGMIMSCGLRTTLWDPGMKGFDLTEANMFSEIWDGLTQWKSDQGWVPGEGNYAFQNQHTRNIKKKVLLQPRLGISHPITMSSKIFFNYGHFYQKPSYSSMYWICQNKGGYGSAGSGLIPVPDLPWPRTVSYEIGYSQSIYDQVLVQISGYYKDYTNETVNLNIQSYYGDIDYDTYMANRYRDVRGIEFRVDRSFGRYINGWVNYDYMIQSSGKTGFETIYENQVKTEDQWSSLEQPRVDARPNFRIGLTLRTPVGFGPGPAILGIKPLADWRINITYIWQDKGERVYNEGAPYENWKYIENLDYKMVDVYLRKNISKGASIYCQIKNPFSIKYYNPAGESYGASLRYPWTSPYSGNDEYGVYDRYYVQKYGRDDYVMWESNKRDIYFGIRYQF